MAVFETIKPAHTLSKYISYYYVDIAEGEDYRNEYICYPHYCNTISLYKSHSIHLKPKHSIVNFEQDGVPLQIFTPLREAVLKVTQLGPVHKIGIVFQPFGINHFLAQEIEIHKTICSPSFSFFTDEFVTDLFARSDLNELKIALDKEFIRLLVPLENTYITKALQIIHAEEMELKIDELAENILGISRKHLNRLFRKYMGTSVEKYRSIVRFRQLMRHKLKDSNPRNLSALSHQAHYTDQSHFVKACKQLTGLTPSQFFKDGKIIGSEDTFWKFTG